MPMFLTASGIRALIGTSLVLHGCFISQLAKGIRLGIGREQPARR